MSFVALRFDATAADAEAWADALLAAGAMSVDVADPNAGTPLEAPRYGEPDVGDASFWPTSRVSALFPVALDAERVLASVGADLGVALPSYQTDVVEDTDWVRMTQSQFVPIHVAESLWIVPSWCEPIDPHATNLRLDPGLAFGTGSHPTTKLCLEWLVAHLRAGESLLDYGCGSGILAIAAARLGAGEVFATDVDTQAVEASRINADLNGVEVTLASPDALPARKFDVVLSNILANPLRLLAPLLAGRVARRGTIVLSGILDAQAEAVAAAYGRWFTIGVWRAHDGWVALSGVRNDVDD